MLYVNTGQLRIRGVFRYHSDIKFTVFIKTIGLVLSIGLDFLPLLEGFLLAIKTFMNAIFLRSFNDWEMEEVDRLLQVLHRKQIRPRMEDKILFKGSKIDVFSVKIMYRVLDCSPQVVFPSRTIWNPVIPPRMGFFAWEASWGKVLTLDQLKRRGRALTNRCFLCEEDEEDINHLLLHCKKAKMLWDLFLSIVGTSWVFPDSVIQTLLSWQGALVGKKRKNIWIAAPLCLFWTVWQNKNMVVLKIGLLRIRGQNLSF